MLGIQVESANTARNAQACQQRKLPAGKNNITPNTSRPKTAESAPLPKVFINPPQQRRSRRRNAANPKAISAASISSNHSSGTGVKLPSPTRGTWVKGSRSSTHCAEPDNEPSRYTATNPTSTPQAAGVDRGSSPNNIVVTAASSHTAGSCTAALPTTVPSLPPTSPDVTPKLSPAVIPASSKATVGPAIAIP